MYQKSQPQNPEAAAQSDDEEPLSPTQLQKLIFGSELCQQVCGPESVFKHMAQTSQFKIKFQNRASKSEELGGKACLF